MFYYTVQCILVSGNYYLNMCRSDLMSLDDIDKTNNAMLSNMLKCAKTCYQILNIRKTLVTQM